MRSRLIFVMKHTIRQKWRTMRNLSVTKRVIGVRWRRRLGTRGTEVVGSSFPLRTVKRSYSIRVTSTVFDRGSTFRTETTVQSPRTMTTVGTSETERERWSLIGRRRTLVQGLVWLQTCLVSSVRKSIPVGITPPLLSKTHPEIERQKKKRKNCWFLKLLDYFNLCWDLKSTRNMDRRLYGVLAVTSQRGTYLTPGEQTRRNLKEPQLRSLEVKFIWRILYEKCDFKFFRTTFYTNLNLYV